MRCERRRGTVLRKPLVECRPLYPDIINQLRVVRIVVCGAGIDVPTVDRQGTGRASIHLGGEAAQHTVGTTCRRIVETGTARIERVGEAQLGIDRALFDVGKEVNAPVRSIPVSASNSAR